MSNGWQGREFMYRWQLFSGHHVCNGKPPDKAVTFLMAKKRTYTNHENSALLSSVMMLNSECMVLLHLKHKIICS